MTGSRFYGDRPYRIAVLHGGPGGPGYMAPVARELAARGFGVVEPLQSADSLEGQILELHAQLRAVNPRESFVLVGSSWGSVLALFAAARFPDLVSRLVLIGSAVFDAASSREVKRLHLSRTPPATMAQIEEAERRMEQASSDDERRSWLARVMDLELDPDVVDPLTRDLEMIEVQMEINQKVWGDFVRLRDSGSELRETWSRVRADTVVVHGDYDPHIIEGILPFLQSCISGVRLEWLERCGHYPWIERHAREAFFEIIERECRHILTECAGYSLQNS